MRHCKKKKSKHGCTNKTSHAQRRAAERAGVQKGTLGTVIQRVKKYGITYYDTKNELQKLIRQTKCGEAKYYGGKIYIFRRSKLITVINVPERVLSNMENNLTDEGYEKYQRYKILRESHRLYKKKTKRDIYA